MVFPVHVPRTLPLVLQTNGWQVANVTLSANVIERDADVTFLRREFDVLTNESVTMSVTVIPNKVGVSRIALTARGNNGAG